MKTIFRKEVKIGICVIVALVILFFGINFLKGVNIFKAANYYYTSYTNVTGLTVSSPVTLNGFKVGQVRDIYYDYDKPGQVTVEMSLDRALKLPAGTKAVLSSDILGTASISLQLGSGQNMLAVGDNVEGVNQPGMLDAVSEQLMPAVAQIFPKVDSLLSSVNALAGDPALKASIGRIDGITSDLLVTSQQISLMAKQLAPLPGRLSPILTDVKDITGNVSAITSDVSSLSGKMKELPVDSLIANLQAASDNLHTLSTQLNDPNSTLGQLMYNPALYNSLNSAVGSLDSLLVDVKKNPKRYVQIKVF